MNVGISYAVLQRSSLFKLRYHPTISSAPMAVISPADQKESSTDVPAQNGTHDGESSTDKPRARLGETSVVQLHNSDSEDEGDEVVVGAEGEEEAFNDPDFLKEYPDDTTVNSNPAFVDAFVQKFDEFDVMSLSLTAIGASSSASTTRNRESA